MIKFLLFLLLVVLTLSAYAKSTPSQSDIQEFERQLAEFRQEMENIGMAVVLVKDNRIVYANQFGVTNVETQKPVVENTMFRIASISKSFTSTSLQQLIEQGKVSLDTDVSTLAGYTIRNPKYPDTPITLEMLLSHTSSINDSEGYWKTIDIINPAYNPNYKKCYNDYEPGKGYEYCNLNFNLLGTFLEKISGERFDQYVVNHVLKPLGLYGGYCVDSLDTSLFASLYERNGNGFKCTDEEAYAARRDLLANYRMGKDALIFSPTGGMKLSAVSLAKYMLMHMNYGKAPGKERIISKKRSKDMQTPRSANENYGLALWTTQDYSPGVTLVGHTGGAYGMRSAMFFNPQKKYGFVVISNGARNTAKDGKTNILTGTLRRMYNCFINKK